MKLTDEQVEFIRTEIDKSTLVSPSLKDDLLDHFCCFIEFRLAKGDSFTAAYAYAYQEICPNGLDEIQKETIYLLTSKKVIAMKKLMYFTGLVTSISVSIGWLFKLLNWPGGGDLFTYGFLGFVLIFLPMLAVDRYKLAFNKVLGERLKVILGFSSAIITGLAVMFKLMHLQGASILLILGTVMFSFGFLPFLFFRMYRKSVE
ncbi:MAG: hypothetical protein AVDCRST_MAG96-3320 [uncultured Segetibacter sp.]|uniref:Uncharacterized protein n=1 Tax=uncultured Segetibacter sp. TaxID=481133 RepID=A0A6J4TMP7_9BACT|nr:MAG: hypothetical protein AVDCRST_MAG96-3320 [uncultured Segetibacter sp.]